MPLSAEASKALGADHIAAYKAADANARALMRDNAIERHPELEPHYEALDRELVKRAANKPAKQPADDATLEAAGASS